MNLKLNSFVVADPNKCIGCRICEVACSVVHTDTENLTAGSMDAPFFPRLTLVQTEGLTMEVNCRHCEDAPCANACPVGAIRQKDNAIVVDSTVCQQTAACVGCKTCLLACPFGVIDLVPIYQNGQEIMQNALTREVPQGGREPKGLMIANKCDLCQDRQEGPACVQYCPEKAMELINPAKNRKEKNLKAALGLLDRMGGLTA